MIPVAQTEQNAQDFENIDNDADLPEDQNDLGEREFEEDLKNMRTNRAFNDRSKDTDLVKNNQV